MARNIVDESTLTVSSTSIGLSSASPTLAATTGAHQAVITVLTAPVCYHQDGGDATTADPILSPGDILNVLGDNMRQVLTNLRFIRLISTDATLVIRWYDRDPFTVDQVTKGSVTLNTPLGDSAMDDTADAVKTLTVAADGTELAKAEDAAHTSGDKGIMALGVRNDTEGALAGTDGDYAPSQLDKTGNIRVVDSGKPLFGKPTLQWLKNNGTATNGRAEWSKEWDRYGQFQAKLMPGVQSGGDDYASVSFTVNDMKLTDLASINYVYRMGATENEAPNIAIHVYDPDIVDARADITYSHTATALGKTSGWQHFELLPASTAAMFYYGNNISESGTTGLTGDNGTSLYTLAQYQADAVFSTYVIGKITIEFGYSSDGTYLNPAHIAKISVNDIDIPLEPSVEEQLDIARDDTAKALTTIPTWTFGEPTLYATRLADAVWARTPSATVYQKSPTQWSALLNGGVQSGDDWASVVIPVNEMPLTDLTSAQWTYYMTNTEVGGANIVVWVHDKADFSKRAEITQLLGYTNKTAGFNVETLNATSDELFYYGENTTGTDLTAGTYYTLTEFQADALFSTWEVYRITIDYGWNGAAPTFDDIWVTEIAINGQQILLKPDSTGTGRIGRRYVTVDTGALALTLAPKTPFRLLNMDVHTSAVLDTGEVLTITKDDGMGTFHDTVIFSDDLFIGSRTSEHYVFGEGYEFDDGVELDFAQANGSNDDIGLVVHYQTVFS